jgi:membrane fusion protein (multidrug efflux system)
MNQPNQPNLKMPQGGNGNGDQPIDEVPMFKRKRVIIPLFLALVAVVAGAWVWYMEQSKSIATDDAYIEAYRSTISSKVPGRIVVLKGDEGDTVAKGDTLVRLDDSDLRAQLQKAEASLRFLTRSVEISSVNKAKALDDYVRIEKQFKAQVVSQEQYNHAESARKLSEAQLDKDEAQIATAQADLLIVKTQIADMVIIAPFSGIIAKRWVLAQDVVQPGQAIFSMFDHKHVWITANYEETKLRNIRPGLRVRISIDAYPGVEIAGKVESIGRSTASQFSLIPANNAAGNFTKITQRVPVKIAVESAPPSVSLLPGLSAYTRIYPK